jgi:hypothetical protein
MLRCISIYHKGNEITLDEFANEDEFLLEALGVENRFIDFKAWNPIHDISGLFRDGIESFEWVVFFCPHLLISSPKMLSYFKSPIAIYTKIKYRILMFLKCLMIAQNHHLLWCMAQVHAALRIAKKVWNDVTASCW